MSRPDGRTRETAPNDVPAYLEKEAAQLLNQAHCVADVYLYRLTPLSPGPGRPLRWSM